MSTSNTTTRTMLYGRIFAKQAERLFSKEIDRKSSIGREEFMSQLGALRKLVYEIGDTGDEQMRMPFLIVVPSSILAISQQVALLESSDSQGKTYLKDSEFRTFYLGAQSDKLYLAYHVVPSSRFTGTAFDFRRWVLERGEYGLTAEEGIALGRNNPGIFFGAPVDLVGSSYGQANRVPFLGNFHNGPRMFSRPEDVVEPDAQAFPACVGRLTL